MIVRQIRYYAPRNTIAEVLRPECLRLAQKHQLQSEEKEDRGMDRSANEILTYACVEVQILPRKVPTINEEGVFQ